MLTWYLTKHHGTPNFSFHSNFSCYVTLKTHKGERERDIELLWNFRQHLTVEFRRIRGTVLIKIGRQDV